MAVAVNGYRLAGVLAALSTAVWFDFFLTQPYGRFTITWRTEIETTVLLLVIGVAVTEISVVGRRQHAVARRRAGYVDGSCGGAPTVVAVASPSAAIDQVASRLARLRHHGMVSAVGWPWDADADGLTAGAGAELLAERGGIFRGRVLLSPFAGAHPVHEQRLPAVAFAGQAGASRPVEEA
jgi:hypothetical protein